MHRVLGVLDLFCGEKKKLLSILIVNIVDDMLIAGDKFAVNQFLNAFNLRFKFGTLMHGPSRLRFFEFNIIQNEDYICTVDGDDKLMALEPAPVTRSDAKK